MKPWTRVGIALGSNLGERMENILIGFRWLDTISTVPTLRSRIYETDPVDCPAGSGPFLNAVCEIGYDGDLPELHQKTKDFEIQCGRLPERVRNEPRPLDLDLLYAEDMVLETPDLSLPHPRMFERLFVIQPLCDIRPNLVLPGQTKTISELLGGLKEAGGAPRLVS